MDLLRKVIQHKDYLKSIIEESLMGFINNKNKNFIIYG